MGWQVLQADSRSGQSSLNGGIFLGGGGGKGHLVGVDLGLPSAGSPRCWPATEAFVGRKAVACSCLWRFPWHCDLLRSPGSNSLC